MEDRTTPAGNVQAFVQGGVLFLVGDGAANRVSVAKTGEKSAFVRPLDGDTAINGRVAELWVGNITRGYDVKLFGGDDVVVLSGVLAKAGLRVEGGDGDDQIFLEGVTSRRQTDVLGGAGNDTLTVTGSDLRRRTAVDLGDGDDRASAGGTTFGRDTYLVGGAGTNTLGLEDNDYRRRLAAVTGFSPVLQTLLPNAANDTATVAAGRAVQIAVTANDRPTSGRIDPASIVITRGPAAGTATPNPDGTITYTSTATAAGTDTLRYVVRNTGGAISNEATVTISVSGPPASPPPPTSPPPVSPPPASPPPPGDTIAPGVTIATTAANPTNATTLPFTVTFNEDVTGFALTDLQLANGTASNFVAVDARTYTFDVAPTVFGTVSVSVPGGVAADAAGNGNTPSSAVGIAYDDRRPTPELDTTASDPTPTSPIPYTVLFTEPVVGFTAADVNVTNGSVINFVAVDGRNFTFDVVPAAPGDVTVVLPAGAARDAAGNDSLVSNSVVVEFTGAVVTPTISTAEPDPTAASPIPFTVTFDDDVTGFDLSDVTVTNGTASNFVAVDARTYTFTVAPAADGPVTVDVRAGVALDTGGAPTAAATPFDIVSAGTDAGMTATMPAVNDPNWVPTGSGLKTWNVVTGSGTAVTASSDVTVFYTGWLASNGTVFDSRRSPAAPVTFPLPSLIQGWQEGLIGMRPGGIRRLLVPPELGYGATGFPPNIPPNATLIFEIKLIAVA